MTIKSPTERHFASAKRFRWFWLAGLVLALTQLHGKALAQIQVGSLTRLHGSAVIERRSRSIAAAQPMPIMLGDELQTSAGSEATILLVNGSQLILSDATRIVVDRSIAGPTPDSIVNLLSGKLRSVITLRAGVLPDFEVHTPNAVAAVRGTDFETEYIEGRPCPGFPQCSRYTDVGVYEGIVEVRNPAVPAGKP
jgi:ferric-dicitrate binding protein FerR (iron transport regulator)